MAKHDCSPQIPIKIGDLPWISWPFDLPFQTRRLQIAFSELHPLDHIEVQPVPSFLGKGEEGELSFWGGGDHTKQNI